MWKRKAADARQRRTYKTAEEALEAMDRDACYANTAAVEREYGAFAGTIRDVTDSDAAAYDAGCDEAMSGIRAALAPGWSADWAGSGNTDSDGSCTEDISIIRA